MTNTNITHVDIADFCEEGTTVEVAFDDITFYVQTHKGRYNTQLGCWIMEKNNDGGEIDQDDYPTVDFGDVIEAAETFINQIKKVTYTNGVVFWERNPQERLLKDQNFWDKQRAKGRPERNKRPEILKIESIEDGTVI